jgi:hypothetical protein
MSGLLKSTVIGFGLLAGVAATAYAQSVSTLPPTSPATAPTAATPPVSSSKIVPNPGGNGTWQEEHYQPTSGYSTDKSQHPYSTSIGPQPGSHSSGQDAHYQATESDNEPGRHPYTSNMGPRPH